VVQLTRGQPDIPESANRLRGMLDADGKIRGEDVHGIEEMCTNVDRCAGEPRWQAEAGTDRQCWRRKSRCLWTNRWQGLCTTCGRMFAMAGSEERHISSSSLRFATNINRCIMEPLDCDRTQETVRPVRRSRIIPICSGMEFTEWKRFMR